MATYYFYDISPADDADCLSIDDVVTRVADTFPRHEISAEEAQSDAKKRLAALEGLNAPEEICRIYREGKPVRCRIAEPDAKEYLEFDVWENQGIQVYPYPKDVENCCLPLAHKLAELLGYRLACEEYD
ncbi:MULTISPECIES: hypothetical protein [Rhodopirellula]|uniref:Uncharacterized protein n=1 Tax=Rhodopirellula europaea SH398 TaxID=1263868 RepID=M5SAM6_9BACT|nr:MULTISPECIES: hypothetical protein [Rhodopirellula]EMI28688.1 hypothetical protein RESH_00743 [Rhodopirellula europaea SH398]